MIQSFVDVVGLRHLAMINQDGPERRISKEEDCTSAELTMSGAVGREGSDGGAVVPLSGASLPSSSRVILSCHRR